MEVEDEDGEVGEIVVVVEGGGGGVEVGFVTGEELEDGDVQETVTGEKLKMSIGEKRGEGKVVLDQEKCWTRNCARPNVERVMMSHCADERFKHKQSKFSIA